MPTPKHLQPLRWLGLIPLAAVLLLSSCYRPEVSLSAPEAPALDNLEQTLNDTLRLVLDERALDADIHAAWQVLHGILAYGEQFPVDAKGETLPAIHYLQRGGNLRGWNFEPGETLPNDRRGLRAVLAPGTYEGQGHADQWLAVLAQCGLAGEDTLQVEGVDYQMRDLLGQVQLDVPFNAEQEWSWTLIGLTHYLPTTASWTAGDGKTWSIEDLVLREIQPARSDLAMAACGGSHRLIGITMAVHKRVAEGAKMSPVWRDAAEVIDHYVAVAQQFQNPDGSFSTNYFQRPGISVDNAQVLSTTGHTLELVALALDAEDLRAPWVMRAVERLCGVLQTSQDLPLECGGLYHAVHGLVVYRDKVFGADSGK